MARSSFGALRRTAPTLFGLAALVAVVVGVALLQAPGDDSGGEVAGSDGAPDNVGVTTTSSPLPQGCETVVVTPPTASDEHLGDLCLPDSVPKGTAIILVHGGGGYGGQRNDMRAWAKVYRDAGYLTVSVDYLIFDDITRSPVYPEPEQDVKAAVQWLRRNAAERGLGVERIVVHGVSAGARLGGQLYVTPDDPYYWDEELWPETPDHIDGFIGFYGYYSGLQFDEDRYYGGPEDSPDPLVRGRWERANSIAIAEGPLVPSLLVHGDQDGLVDVAQTERFAAAIEDADADVTDHVVPGAGHAFDLEEDGTLSVEGRALAPVVLDWIADHVG